MGVKIFSIYMPVSQYNNGVLEFFLRNKFDLINWHIWRQDIKDLQEVIIQISQW